VSRGTGASGSGARSGGLRVMTVSATRAVRSLGWSRRGHGVDGGRSTRSSNTGCCHGLGVGTVTGLVGADTGGDGGVAGCVGDCCGD
jgi:hypothetical protein